MKKILFLSLLVLFNTFVLAENFTSLDCNDTRLTGYKTGTLSTGTSYQCGTCFKTSDLYYRSGHAIENITNLYDGFDVPGASPRIMWTDETWVDWDVLNPKFTIGSDLSETRSDPKGFKFENISVSDPQRQPFWMTANNAPNTGRIFGIFYTTDPLLTYVRSTGGISLDGVSSTATPSDLNKPMWRVAFNAASRTTNIETGVDGPLEDHIQCAFVFPKWCGDGFIDTNKSEQCDNGTLNGTAGNTCSATCQTINPAILTCNNLTISPTILTRSGGDITATCTASVSSGTQYKLVLKQGSTVINPNDTYQSSATKIFSIPSNSNTNSKTYSVDCYVKNGSQTDKTDALCHKEIIVPGTPSESSCTSLTVSPVSATVTGGGDLRLTCVGSGTISSYRIVVTKPNGSDLRTITSASGTVTIPATPIGTYTAQCFVNGQTSTPTACQKDIYNNAPEVPAVCANFLVSDQSISTGGSVSYECRTDPLIPPVGTTYSIKKSGAQISTAREGVTTFPTAGTYTLNCAVNGASVVLPVCEKTITVSNPQPLLPVCDNLDVITSGALTYAGGTITAVCSGTNTDAYKFIFKQGSTEISTIDYQSSATKTFTIPENTATTNKEYSVECYAKNAQNAGVTSETCNKNLTISGAPVCNSLSVSSTSTTPNTLIAYVCDASNATSYNITNGAISIGDKPTGSMNFNAPGTYDIKCFIDGRNTTAAACMKSITITTPPPNPIPSIFIDKDDSTPGTPDDDGNDIQRVQNNGTATFTVRFTNNGNEALKNVVITDQYASDCNRSSSQTASLYAGGTTANFDVSETFSYVCTKTNVTSSTFPSNRNTASITGVGVTSSQNVADSDVTEIFMKQSNPNIKIEKNDADNLDDEQEIEEDETAEFSVKVTNDGDESLENLIITDELSSDCAKDTSETRELIEKIGDHDSIFDPGEFFLYTCQERSVTSDTFPDETNTVCVEGRGVDTNQNVDDCDYTNIIIVQVDEPSICEYIESSEGSFGGAPFRTEITCNTTDSSSTCQIEVSRDGDVINTYEDCSRDITFTTPGEYSVACIVDDERYSECEMGITVEAMTEVPTGTKILIVILFSLVFAGFGTYIYARKKKLS